MNGQPNAFDTVQLAKGKVTISAIQRFATLGFSLLLLAVSQQANAQQKMEFKFNLKEIFKTDGAEAPPRKTTEQAPVHRETSTPADNSHPVVGETTRPTQRQPDTALVNHSADGADKMSKDYWITRFWQCASELGDMQASGKPFPSNDCATALESEFMGSGLADSKVTCLDQVKRDYGKADRIGREPPSMNYVMKAGQKNPGSSKKASMGPFMTNQKMLSFHNEQLAQHRCNQEWPYRSLFMSWDKMRIARDDVRGAMNTAHLEQANRQELDAMIAEENAAVAHWRKTFVRPGRGVYSAVADSFGRGDVIETKGSKALITYRVCTSISTTVGLPVNLSNDANPEEIGEEFGQKIYRVCNSYGNASAWFDRADLFPSSWVYDDFCRAKSKMYGVDIACWKERRDTIMPLLKR